MSDQLFREIGQQFAELHGTSVGQMFGKPCLKVGKKAFVAFFKDEMVFKLGQQEIKSLLDQYPSSVNWDPSGKQRPMKDWLQIPVDHSDDWARLSKQALDYVEANM